MLKVPYGQDPYSVIGKYIRDHIAAIEDIIAVIEIDDITTHQLFMVDMDEENYFIWNNDWYEGEKDVTLIDFFPVSEAINPSAQSEPSTEIQEILNYLDTTLHPIVSPDNWNVYSELHDMVSRLPSAQPDGIPLEWIDKHLEWLDNCDNDFAQLAKVSIRAMVEIWKKDKT